ncbi:MAG: hypothetical protein K8T26_11025 [Lentisphaerae bacterium]|nr:hypothetical protein [Lentisphaerota bacterium]
MSGRLRSPRLPQQLSKPSTLVRSWSVEHPRFYGLPTSEAFVERLFGVEAALQTGAREELDPRLCRVLAAFHGPKGAKVPLVATTVAGCVRPAFVALNPSLLPGGNACYGGGCYLYHARAVPAKKAADFRVRAHKTPREALLGAARLSRHYGLSIRDNQTSDGSHSMALLLPGESISQLHNNLSWLAEAGFADVPYLCFSSAYVTVQDKQLQALSSFPQLTVHVTVSGWHSHAENLLRLAEFERYRSHLRHTCLRIVNRQDWAVAGTATPEGAEAAAQCEEWLLAEIVRRGLSPYVIRTPFHSVHPFPGSSPGSLGSRHMAGTSYSKAWGRLTTAGARECCTTGKCKTCPTACGTGAHRTTTRQPIVAARALEVMYHFEERRQLEAGTNPLAVYTSRMLARKSAEAYADAGALADSNRMQRLHDMRDREAAKADLSPLQRRRLANDSHALVVDGMDRHGLWRGAVPGHEIAIKGHL